MMKKPTIGDRVFHAGNEGVLLAIGSDDRCTILFADGTKVDNIYIGDLERLSP